ncbi:MAG: hypothetical protein DPW18_18375 [Chloroflexi bacterium]|nr:hypothetical protein [Chloroflexota bacterium]MDL1940755.1 hypothetical protein [Chloroflexi bacterium CFX2]
MTRILFERTGGFMGRKVSLELDLDELPAPQAGTLKRLLDETGFSTLEAAYPAPSSARDVFTYQITVETESGRHTVQATDLSMPNALRPLVGELSRLAQTRRS